jgi:hypothetical protein
MNENEHERLSNLTLSQQTYIKIKVQHFFSVPHFTVTVGFSIMSITLTLKYV